MYVKHKKVNCLEARYTWLHVNIGNPFIYTSLHTDIKVKRFAAVHSLEPVEYFQKFDVNTIYLVIFSI